MSKILKVEDFLWGTLTGNVKLLKIEGFLYGTPLLKMSKSLCLKKLGGFRLPLILIAGGDSKWTTTVIYD